MLFGRTIPSEGRHQPFLMSQYAVKYFKAYTNVKNKSLKEKTTQFRSECGDITISPAEMSRELVVDKEQYGE